MVQHGGGTGTPIPGGVPQAVGGSGTGGGAVSLARYIQRLGLRECAFWGVRYETDGDYPCYDIWTLQQREDVAFALLEAQEEIEQEAGFFLVPKWVVAERHPWKGKGIFVAEHGKVIAGGIMSDVMILAGAPVNLALDPAVIGPIAGVTCAEDSIHVYLPGSDIEITPSAMALVGGALTINIPLCRLVAEANLDNPAGGWDYTDPAAWATATVDLRCITNDISTQASLIYRMNPPCGCEECGVSTETGCITVRLGEIGSLDVKQATYSAGVWTRTTRCYVPYWVDLNYLSGMSPTSRQAEDAVIRLAHSKMIKEPCGCDHARAAWDRDMHVPEVMGPERASCPFGLSDGAWIAWRFVQQFRMGRGSPGW